MLPHTAGVGELLSERKSPSPPIWCETYWELLVVQRLQLYALTAKSWGFIPGSQSRWSGLGSRVTEAHASLLVGRLGIGGWAPGESGLVSKGMNEIGRAHV